MRKKSIKYKARLFLTKQIPYIPSPLVYIKQLFTSYINFAHHTLPKINNYKKYISHQIKWSEIFEHYKICLEYVT